MAKDKKSFIFYSDWIDTFKELPKDKGYDLLLHILAYVNDENPETEDFVISAIFAQMKNTLKRDLKKWEDQRLQRVDAGKKSAEVRRTKRNDRSTTVNEKERKPTVSVSDSVKVSVNDNDKVKDINKRKQAFKSLINETVKDSRNKYKDSKQDLIDFFEYWSEHGINDKKMRFEKQKSFGITRRLDTWFKNKEKFNNKKTLQKDQSDFSTPDTGWNKTKK